MHKAVYNGHLEVVKFLQECDPSTVSVAAEVSTSLIDSVVAVSVILYTNMYISFPCCVTGWMSPHTPGCFQRPLGSGQVPTGV